jgi:hypothetical protein
MASVLITAVMMIGFIEFSIAYVILVAPFLVDAAIGVAMVRQTYSHEGFVKPTFTKELVFVSSQVDTI